MESEMQETDNLNNGQSQPLIGKDEQDKIIRVLDMLGDEKTEAYLLIAAKYDDESKTHEFVVEYSSLFAIRELLNIGESFVDEATFVDWSSRFHDDGE